MGTQGGSRGFREGTKKFKDAQTFRRRLRDGPDEEWMDTKSTQWGGWAEERAQLREEAKNNNMTVEEWTKVKSREVSAMKPEPANDETKAVMSKKEKNKKKKASKKKAKAAKAAKKNEIMNDEDTKVNNTELNDSENEDKVVATENMDKYVTKITGNKAKDIENEAKIEEAESTDDADAYITSNECNHPDEETSDDDAEVTLAENEAQQENGETHKQTEVSGEEVSGMMDSDSEIELPGMSGLTMLEAEVVHALMHMREYSQDLQQEKDSSPQGKATSANVSGTASGSASVSASGTVIHTMPKPNRFSLKSDATTKQKKKKAKSKVKAKAKDKDKDKSKKWVILKRPETTSPPPTATTGISPDVTSSGRKLRVDAPSWFPSASPTPSPGATSFPSPYAKPFSPSSFVAASSSPFAATPSPLVDQNTNDRHGKATEVDEEDNANNSYADDADAGYSTDLEDHRSLRGVARPSLRVPSSSVGIARSMSVPGLAGSSSGIPSSASGVPLSSPGVAPGGGYLTYKFAGPLRNAMLREVALQAQQRKRQEQERLQREVMALLAPLPSPSPSTRSRANSVSSVGSWTEDDEFCGPMLTSHASSAYALKFAHFQATTNVPRSDVTAGASG